MKKIAIPVNLIENMCKALSEYEHSDGNCFSKVHDACVDIDAFCRDKLNEPSSEDYTCNSCKTPCVMHEKEMCGCKSKVEELFERVENIESQIKEDKEEQLKAELDYRKEQLKKLEEELAYEKFRLISQKARWKNDIRRNN